jgi:membrane associated rhomboid family serine protease
VDEPDPTTAAQVCYRHPERPTRLSCARCERPICGDDAIEAPVGFQCPTCASGGTPVRHLGELLPDARVTRALVVAIAIAYLVTQADRSAVFTTYGLVPVAVGQGQWWRLVTGAFLHAGLMHIGFNGLLLWRLGQVLEPVLGHARYAALYASGLAGGSLGVVLLSWATVVTPLASIPVLGWVFTTHPGGVTVGASGAVFGLMGAAMVDPRARGTSPWRTDIGGLVLLNLVITVLVPGISVGGHLGGLLAGMLAGRLVFVEPARRRRAVAATVAFTLGMLWLAVTLATAMLGPR